MLLKAYFAYLKLEKQHTLHTREAYRSDLQQLAVWLRQTHSLDLYHSEDADQIKPRHLRGWMAALQKEGLQARSIIRKCSAANSYFDFLLQKEAIRRNPLHRLRLPKISRKLPGFLKEQEAEALFEQVDFPSGFEGSRDRLMLELLYGCGLRRGELIGLKWEDVDLYERSIRVHGKGNKVRLVPFGHAVLNALEGYQTALGAAGLQADHTLLRRPDGKPLYASLVYRRVKKYLQQIAHLPQASPHSLRHSFATHMLDRGADLNAIKELLGHQSLAATQIYTHNSISKLKAVHNQAHPRAEESS